jgi:hypothetical protein
MTGVVSDAETGECIPYASVVYKGHHVAVVADIEGRYSIARHNGWIITYSAVGYIAQDITISEGDNSRLNIKLKPDNRQLKQVTIHAKRGRYSRKNNPAVELMKKVIAAKKLSDLSNHDYYRYDKYEKLTLGANDITPEQLEKKPFSSTPWLKEQVEVCQYNNKLILPISVDETVTEMIW